VDDERHSFDGRIVGNSSEPFDEIPEGHRQLVLKLLVLPGWKIEMTEDSGVATVTKVRSGEEEFILHPKAE
jgi:hypothetical protein